MQMEEAKEVVKIAATFLAEQEPTARNNRLEQIEDRSGDWSVVLSFPDPTSAPFSAFGAQEVPRVYKELVVNSKSKEVMALRFWK